jgi:hypothetical protein
MCQICLMPCVTRRRKTAIGKPYSQDSRERVLSAIDDGGDAYEIAPLFNVSVWLGWQHHGEAQRPHPAGLGNDASLGQQGRRPPTLVHGKQLAAVLRIKPLWRLRCCGLPVFCRGEVGASGKTKISTPSCLPRVIPSCAKLGWAD